MDVNLTPLYDAGGGILYTILTGLAAWVAQATVAWLSASTKVDKAQLNATLGVALNDGLHRGIDLAFAAARRDMEQKGLPRKIRIDNMFVAIAANYVIPRFQETLINFGWGPDDVKRAIIARAAPYLQSLGIEVVDPTIDLIVAEGAVAAADAAPTTDFGKDAPADPVGGFYPAPVTQG